MKQETALMAALAIICAAVAFVGSTVNHSWSGSDDQAEGVISGLTGGSYHPWFEPIWKPPSNEIESLFFSLQAAIGGAVIGYFLGRYRRAEGARPAENKKMD